MSIQGPVSYPKNPLTIAGNDFPWDGVDTLPKWPQIPFLSPSTLVDLCTKQSPPAYSRFLWVYAPSSPSQGGDPAPSSTLLGGVPPHLSAQLPCCRPLPANVKGLGVEKQNPSRRVRCLSCSRRFKSQGLGVVPNGTCLLKVRGFPAHAPNVVATHSGKQTHSEGQCR